MPYSCQSASHIKMLDALYSAADIMNNMHLHSFQRPQDRIYAARHRAGSLYSMSPAAEGFTMTMIPRVSKVIMLSTAACMMELILLSLSRKALCFIQFTVGLRQLLPQAFLLSP